MTRASANVDGRDRPGVTKTGFSGIGPEYIVPELRLFRSVMWEMSDE